MATLVLFSTLSLTVEKHFCGGELVEVAVFSNLDKCCGDKESDKSSETIEASCCKNQLEVIEGQNELKLNSSIELKQNIEYFVISFFTAYVNLFEEDENITSYNHYRPPIVVKNIHVLNETFLIWFR